MRRAALFGALGLGLVVATGFLGNAWRERSAKLEIARQLGRQLAWHRDRVFWSAGDSMGPGEPAAPIRFCSVARRLFARASYESYAHCAPTAPGCVVPEADRIVPCRPAEVIELQAGDPTPTGGREHPACAGGFTGPVRCVVTLESRGESRKVAVVVR